MGFDEGDIPPEEERSAIKLCEKVVALADRHQAVVAGSVDATGAVAAARVMRTYIAVQELQIVKAKDWSNCGVLLGDALDSVESIRQMSAHLHKHSFPHKGEIDSKFTQSSSPHVWHAQSETCLLSSTTQCLVHCADVAHCTAGGDLWIGRTRTTACTTVHMQTEALLNCVLQTS